ncbi:hypothetical protein HZC09_04780 [Candidatus Micrarchaeota archaeon]|nr:hypothetical protein [Candidatus Micrarchaeota archaeon]
MKLMNAALKELRKMGFRVKKPLLKNEAIVSITPENTDALLREESKRLGIKWLWDRIRPHYFLCTVIT